MVSFNDSRRTTLLQSASALQIFLSSIFLSFLLLFAQPLLGIYCRQEDS